MKHRAHAPELAFAGPEPFALVPERAVDWDERARQAAQQARDRAASARHQLPLEPRPLKTENLEVS